MGTETTFKITSAAREFIIADNVERIKVTAEFSNGKTQSYHFELATTPEEIRAELAKVCQTMDLEAVQKIQDAERNALEDAAEATIADLLV